MSYDYNNQINKYQEVNKLARIISGTGTKLFRVGLTVNVKSYDPADNKYLIIKNSVGIWVNPGAIQFLTKQELFKREIMRRKYKRNW